MLTARALSIAFGSTHVVRGVSFSVYPGQTLAIVGESGSGKSVTALSILGLLPHGACVSAGRIEFTDPHTGVRRDLLHIPSRELREIRGGRIAMIFQEPMTSLNPVMPVGEQVAEAIRLHRGLRGTAAREAASRALAAVGIESAHDRARDYPHQFSGGMRQRVMIAMALSCRPAILIADEPTTALDASISGKILDLIQAPPGAEGLSTPRMGVLLITHDLRVVAKRADVVCVMCAGRVVEYGRARDVLARPVHPYTRALLACAPRMGERTERLMTVADLAEGPRSIGSHRAWLPGESQDRAGLVRIEEDRWALVTSAPDQVGDRERNFENVPDLMPRVGAGR